jgi:hypothetical protein
MTGGFILTGYQLVGYFRTYTGNRQPAIGSVMTSPLPIRITAMKRVTVLAALALIATLAETIAGRQQAGTFDLLIRNGRVLDGTGNPWFPANVAVERRAHRRRRTSCATQQLLA